MFESQNVTSAKWRRTHAPPRSSLGIRKSLCSMFFPLGAGRHMPCRSEITDPGAAQPNDELDETASSPLIFVSPSYNSPFGLPRLALSSLPPARVFISGPWCSPATYWALIPIIKGPIPLKCSSQEHASGMSDLTREKGQNFADGGKRKRWKMGLFKVPSDHVGRLPEIVGSWPCCSPIKTVGAVDYPPWAASIVYFSAIEVCSVCSLWIVHCGFVDGLS